MNDILTLIQVIIGIIIIFGGIIATVKWTHKRLSEWDKIMTLIQKELSPNGGESIKDVIVRLGEQYEQHEARLSSIEVIVHSGSN